MSLFDDKGKGKLLVAAFNMPSEKKAEQMMARRLCRMLGIDFQSLDHKAEGQNALLSQIIEIYVDMNPSDFKKVRGLLPSKSILADELRRSAPETAYGMTATLRGMAY